MTLIFAKTTKKILEGRDFLELTEESKEVFGPKLRMENNICKKSVNYDEEDDQSIAEELWGREGSRKSKTVRKEEWYGKL